MSLAAAASTSAAEPAGAPLTEASDDLALLRAFEPIVRYNDGELFFPAAVDGYLAGCDLLEGNSERDRKVVVPVGQVTKDVIASWVSPPGMSLYLRYVQEPLTGIALARWQTRPDRTHFRAPGRLARVGLFGRLVDAGFNASLLARGTVPGGAAAAAQVKYAAYRQTDPRYVYHGRVVRRNGWIVLQYLFFHFMNDYRSTFNGANDHEADWEQMFIYLEPRPEGVRPVWIAAAAHDYIGDQLRRRWDDPALVKVGDHPVIFAGAGSHASYFEQGEYLTSIPLAAFRGLTNFMDVVRSFWTNTLRQPDPGDLGKRLENALSASFVDYARGDGLAVGPGQAAQWSPELISDATPWVDGYRGLFGLDTHDRFGGERAPAGPKYSRDGSQRLSWHDPLGFAGLDKAAPPYRWPEVLRERESALLEERAQVAGKIEDAVERLPGLVLEVQALGLDGAMAKLHASESVELATGELELRHLRAGAAAIDDRLSAVRRELARVEAGDLGDPRAHLLHPHKPVPPEDSQYGFLVELWSAASVGLLLVIVAALIWLRIVPWWTALFLGVVGYVVIESALRRRLTQLLLVVTVALASVGALVIVWQLKLQLILLGFILLALVILSENVREILRR
ncbi:MAG: hypothetical protein U0869_06510 [Chloroflexota bacterium]